MNYIIKKYVFHYNEKYKILKQKLYDVLDKDINISKDEKIKLFEEIRNPTFKDDLISKIGDKDVIEKYNTYKENVIKIFNEIFDKIENNTLTKNDIDILLEKFENLFFISFFKTSIFPSHLPMRLR